MNIGIDIDGTITDIRSYIFDHGKSYFEGKVPNKEGYEIAEIYNTTIDEENNFWNKYFLDYMKHAKLNRGAKEALKELSINNRLYILTSRIYKDDYKSYMTEEEFHKYTIDYLDRNNIEYESVLFTQDKKILAKTLKLDIMIEDRIENILSISEICPVIVIDNENNKSACGDNIYHAKNWSEILKLLKDFK